VERGARLRVRLAAEEILRSSKKLASTATAVSQLPYNGAEIAERLFHQEKATLENAEKCTGIVKPLESRALITEPESASLFLQAVRPNLTCMPLRHESIRIRANRRVFRRAISSCPFRTTIFPQRDDFLRHHDFPAAG